MLSGKQARAAVLVAEDLLSNDAIAAEVGCSRRTLFDWRRREDFSAAVDEHRANMAEIASRFGVGSIESQLQRLNEHRKGILEVIRQRGANACDGYPGEETGLIVKDYKGKEADVPVFSIDTGALGELRAIELQALKITGQLVERKDVTSGGKPMDVMGLSELDEAELDRRIAAAEARKASSAV